MAKIIHILFLRYMKSFVCCLMEVLHGNSDLPKSNQVTAAPTTLDETGCSEVSTTVGNADKDDTNSFGRPILSPY